MGLLQKVFGVSVQDGMANVADQLRLQVVQPVLADVRNQLPVPQEFSWLPDIYLVNIAGAVAPQEHELVNEILGHYDDVLTDEQLARCFARAVRTAKLEALREHSYVDKSIVTRAHHYEAQARRSWIKLRGTIKDQTDTREMDQALNDAEYDMLEAVWQSSGRPDGERWMDIILAAVYAFSEIREHEFALGMLRAVARPSDLGQQVQDLCSFLDTESAAITADLAERDRTFDRSLKELKQLGDEAEVIHRAAGGLRVLRRR